MKNTDNVAGESSAEVTSCDSTGNGLKSEDGGVRGISRPSQAGASPLWFVEAETLKAKVLGLLEAMSLAERNRAPGADEWSAAQVVTHLVLLEERLVNVWRAEAEKTPNVKPGARAALTVGMVNAAMRGPLRIPTPPMLDIVEAGDLRDLSYRWEAVRQRMLSTLPSDPSRSWVVHPIFGRLTMEQMGSFIVAHLQYHLRHWPALGKAG